MQDFAKCARGQVWWIKEQTPQSSYMQNIQLKDRPWLIVSCNRANDVSPIVTAIPMTSREYDKLPCHVPCTNSKGDHMLMVEQIQSFSMKALFSSGSYYMYTATASLMEAVNDAMAKQLGIDLVFPNSERFWDEIQKMIRFRVSQVVKEAHYSALDISKIAVSVTKSIDDAVADAVKVEEKDPGYEEETSDAILERVQDVSEEKAPHNVGTWVPVKKKKTRSNRWTDERAREFMKDAETMKVTELAAKYNIERASVYGYKQRFKTLVAGGAKEG